MTAIDVIKMLLGGALCGVLAILISILWLHYLIGRDIDRDQEGED